MCPWKTAGGKNIAGGAPSPGPSPGAPSPGPSPGAPSPGAPSPGAPSPGAAQRVAVPAPWWKAGLTKGCP